MQSFLLKAGYVVSFTTDAYSSSTYEVIKDNLNSASGPISLSASTTTKIGPFNIDKRYLITENGSPVTININFVDLSTAMFAANKVSDLTPLGQTLVANIGNSATGTQIATAVNGILAILIAAGLMKSS